MGLCWDLANLTGCSSPFVQTNHARLFTDARRRLGIHALSVKVDSIDFPGIFWHFFLVRIARICQSAAVSQVIEAFQGSSEGMSLQVKGLGMAYRTLRLILLLNLPVKHHLWNVASRGLSVVTHALPDF